MKHIQEIRRLVKVGVSAAPVKIADKYPSMLKGWRAYMKNPPRIDEVNMWQLSYTDPNVYGCCVICGEVSGGLEVIDFDNHIENAQALFDTYTSIDEVAAITDRLPIEKTQSGGFHIFYRCETIEGNQKLAKDATGKITVIETRGEGGLIVCAPTKGYTIISGNLQDIPTITTDERDILLSHAASFNEYVEPIEPPTTPTTHHTDNERPGDYYNENHKGDVPTLLKSHGWTQVSDKNWRRPNKTSGVSATLGHVAAGVFYVFSSNANPFDVNRAYNPFQVLTLLEHNGDFSAAAKEIAVKYNLEKKTSKKEQVTSNLPIGSESDFPDFWMFSDKGAFKLDFYKLRQLLIGLGFSRYEMVTGKYEFLRIKNNVAEIYTWERVRSLILSMALHNREPDIYNHLSGYSKLDKKYLSDLPDADVEWMRDTEKECYLFYRNCIVKIEEFTKSVIYYNDLPGVIWENQIIDRNYDTLKEEAFDNCDVSEFAKLVCNQDIKRLGAYMGSLGYLVHNYKRASFAPVIVLYDEDGSGEASGGSGKGLTVQFVEKVRNVVKIDGKMFSTKERFAMQRVNRDTQIIAIDDIPRKYDFESMFSMITDGLTINKLYMGEMYIPYKESPKFVFPSNYPITGDSDSFQRRMFEIEIHKFFGKNLTPEQHFKREFFDGWDAVEWNRFDNFMAYCVQYYLRNGLEKPDYIHIAENKLRATTSPDFMDWAKGYIKLNVEYRKTDLRDAYQAETGDTMTGSRRFGNWYTAYAKFKGWTIERAGNGGSNVMFTDREKVEFEDVSTDLPF